MYSIAYVTECIRQNTLLPSLEAFTLGLLLGGEGHENPLDLTLGLQPKREWSNMEISESVVKAEDVKEEYMEIQDRLDTLIPRHELGAVLCCWLYWAVVGYTGLHRAILSCTRLYLSVQGCDGLYWAVLDCTGLY